MTSTETGTLVGGIISIILGITVMVAPRILAWLIGIYLVIIGIIAIVTAVS